MPEYITDDIEISSDSDKEDSDEENSSEEDSDEQNLEENQVQNVFNFCIWSISSDFGLSRKYLLNLHKSYGKVNFLRQKKS